MRMGKSGFQETRMHVILNDECFNLDRFDTITCVYTINDREAFNEDEQKRITKNFKPSKDEPLAITAMSLGHEIHRLGLIEEAHDKKRYDLLDDIFGIIDPASIESISQLDGY